MTDHQGTEGTPALAASNRQRMPVFALGKVTLLLLALFAGASLTVATAQSTAETLGADTAACRQSNDNVACERAYDYLTAEMQAVEPRIHYGLYGVLTVDNSVDITKPAAPAQ